MRHQALIHQVKARDWAARGPALLGVRAVIAESFERLHRANLASVGILPLELTRAGEASTLAGDELFDIPSPEDLRPGQEIRATVRLDTMLELAWFRHGGAIPYLTRAHLDG